MGAKKRINFQIKYEDWGSFIQMQKNDWLKLSRLLKSMAKKSGEVLTEVRVKNP